MYFRNGLYLSLCNFHLEMQLNNIIIASVMVSDAYAITNTDLIPPKKWPIPPKMADTTKNWPIPISVTGIGASLPDIWYESE